MINSIVKKFRNVINNLPLRGHFEYMFSAHHPPQLGRWGLLHDDRVNFRMDRSNIDNCGPCGYNETFKNKIELNESKIKSSPPSN